MSNPIKPITPKEVDNKKIQSLPDIVLNTFNNAIIENWNGKQATFGQNKIAIIIAKELNITIDKVYNLGYMDIEPLYQKAGWKVTYDKPAYNESYEATYTFHNIYFP